MSDDLLPFYEKELAFLRQSGAEFGRIHPKIAGRLRMSGDVVEDPHVSRLLEGVAYLNSRIQYRLDDDFSELSDALLDQLYPHYLRPIPSMTVVQFKPAKDLDAPLKVKRHARLESEPFQGRVCSFMTGYELDILPVAVTQAALKERPFVTPGSQRVERATSVIHVRLEGFTEDIDWAELGTDKLRFFLRGQSHYAYALYELLLNHCVQVVMTKGPDDTEPRLLGTQCIQPVGFAEDEALLPCPNQSFPGYRLLTEYMVFPEKFLFLDIEGLKPYLEEGFGSTLEFYFYLDRSHTELERNLSADNFALGCTPIINLFKHRAEPISLEHEQYSYTIIPDARYPDNFETYSIEQVQGLTGDGKKKNYRPFYGLTHFDINRETQHFWHAQRYPKVGGELGNEPGSEMEISLIDLNFSPADLSDETLSLDLFCFNRNTPEKLPFGGGQPQFKCLDIGVTLEGVHTLTHLTPTIRPPLRDGARWRLVSHLALNYLSLDSPNAIDVLKELLSLYDFQDSAASRALIAALVKVQTNPITAPVTLSGKTTVCRGVEIEVTFDETLMSGNSTFLFASILERFFALYCSINTFTRLVARVKGRQDILKKWPPRIGNQPLI
ncbi:type VI secretion system baseplate subunit TssF [Hahella ganghwensis]|uniref:type VI secretion system baseplate subunit TssF n=1 Tax=Hahella ganghwensis TaxID=286420 RepID=UPI000380C924|nr:type VI secretion system baseplate subunit TssF [Hahella ganghwensis]